MEEGGRVQIAEVLPKAGLVYSEKGQLSETLSKPKIMPLKSITLERIEQMEREAREAVEAQEAREKEEKTKEKEKEAMERGDTRRLEGSPRQPARNHHPPSLAPRIYSDRPSS